jgi:hypothetical protein
MSNEDQVKGAARLVSVPPIPAFQLSTALVSANEDLSSEIRLLRKVCSSL